MKLLVVLVVLLAVLLPGLVLRPQGREFFLADRRAHEMGLATVPLVRLYDPAERAIRQAGGAVMLSTSADHFAFDGNRVTALGLGDGQTLEADAFVSAVPFWSVSL